MEGNAAGLPDGYLERAAERGVNGVWIQAVLNTLAPAKAFPEFGEGWQTRLRNLRQLTERLDKFGIKVYLYLNEPRAMPASFFAQRPDIRGTKSQDLYSMCTSTPVVRDWIRASLGHVFQHAPQLGGVFSITMSENHTNCFSHGGAWGDKYPVATDCPRCSKRKGGEVIAELLTTFRDGIRDQSKDAKIISWDWGWGQSSGRGFNPAASQRLHLHEYQRVVDAGVSRRRAHGSWGVFDLGSWPGPAGHYELEAGETNRPRNHG